MKHWFKIISINILVLLLFLLFLEAGSRFFWKMSTLKGEIYITSKDRNLRYELKPGTSSIIEGMLIEINSDGFRDREFSIAKPENTYRIIVLGDSETFSKALPLEDTMPKQLEHILNSECPGKNYEVFNMGVEGYNAVQELELLKSKGLKYKPDLVILYYCFNDPDYPEYYFKKNFLNKNFALARFVQYRIKKYSVKKDRLSKGIKSEEDNFSYLYSDESWGNTKEILLDMARLTRKEGIRFILVVAPEMSLAVFNFRDAYPYWYINEKLSHLRDAGIGVLDPTYLFKEKNINPLDLVISEKDRHKNAKANFLIASYLRENLAKKKIIPCN